MKLDRKSWRGPRGGEMEKGQEVTCEVKCHADAGSEGHKEEQGGNRRKEKKKETMLKTHHNKM